MSENMIEITQKIQDRHAIQKDCSDALELVGNMFRERYFDQMRNVVAAHQSDCQKNPPKEIQLLNVMKQFAPESKADTYDRVIDMMLLMNTVSSMRSEIGVRSDPPRKDRVLASSVHPDGVYDIDPNCTKASQPASPDLLTMFMVMAFSNMKK